MRPESTGILETSGRPESVSGAASPYFGLWAMFQVWSTRVSTRGSSHDPRGFINSRRLIIRVWVLFRLICQEQFRRSTVCETPTREFNHTSAIWLHPFVFLLVFFDSQAGISLLGEVDRASTG